MKLKDLTGVRIGRLEVLQRAGTQLHPNGKSSVTWWCKCDCGNLNIVSTEGLRAGTQSCGCLKREKTIQRSRRPHTKGLSGTRIYSIYLHMTSRCNNPKDKRYYDYGGRGIKVIGEWLGEDGFLNFYAWANNSGYSDGLSIDRIDNNEGYSPENCRWATPKMQQRNKRNNRLVTYNGETRCLAEWAEILKIRLCTLNARLNRGWNTERALSTPVQKRHRKR